MNINRPFHGSVEISGRIQRRRRAMRLVLGAIAPIAAALAPVAGAAVQLSGVSSGTASVSQNGAVTNIRTSNNAILNFSQFNIAAGSTVNFLQPSAASRVLDRVNSATPSIINGSLLSNGTVYLINPAGVIFGGGSVINVNNFYVAGSHMSDADFLGNVNHFSGISGIVSNSGQIHANQAYLIGSQVINQGSIVSPGGVVAMLSGSDVIVSEPGSHVTATVVPAVSASSTPGSAPKTDLRMSALAAGDAYSLAIRHTGSIQAGTVLINGGSGQVQVSGTIDASSHTSGVGGTVSITGGEVQLISAMIDASGPAGGGDVLIGGAAHGSGDLPHATNVFLDSGTTIDTDATANGAGGSIVLWSDGTTSSAAMLTSRGGPLGGNGGYIETSGDLLHVTSAPIASATDGKPGVWVMDPLNITIVNSAVDQGTAAFTGQSTINNGTIETALLAGTSVLITTNQAGTDAGTLTQNPDAPITVTLVNASPVTLTLQATADMTLSGGIISTGMGVLNVELDQLSSTAHAIVINTNPITVNGSLSILGGNINITATSTTPLSTAASLQLGSGTAGTGQVLTGGTVSINSPVTIAGNITIVNNGATNVNAAVKTTNAGNFSATGGTSFTSNVGGIFTIAGGITISGTGVDSFSAGITTAAGGFSDTGESSFTTTAPTSTAVTGGSLAISGGNITVVSTGVVSIGATVNTGGGAFSATGESSFTTTVPTSTAFTGGSLATGGGNITVVSTGVVSIGATVNTGGGAFSATGTSFQNSGTISDGNTATGLNAFSVNTSSGVGAININSPITWTGGTGRSVTLEGGGTITIAPTGGITGAGALPVSFYTTGIATSGAVSLNGIVKSPGGAFISSGGNFIVGANATTPTTVMLNVLSASINNATVTPDAKALTLGTITIGGPVVTNGGDLTIGGTTLVLDNGSGTITTNGGNVDITTVSPVTIGEAVNTTSTTGVGGAISVTASTSFTTSVPASTLATGGSLTTGGGNITVVSTGALSIGATVNTGGGAFSATGTSFTSSATMTNGGINTGTMSLTINTTSGTGAIAINDPISWGGSGSSVLIEGASNITVASTGSIQANAGSGPVAVSLYTTGATSTMTLDGPVVTTGDLIIDGGNFTTINPTTATTTPTGAFLGGGSISINTSTVVPGIGTATLGTVAITMPVIATASGGGVSIGGTGTSLTGLILNQDGAITTNDGDVTLTNTGLIAWGGPTKTNGGSFIATGILSFTEEGSITTSGGNVSISTNSTTDAITIGQPVDTGGGSFSAIGLGFTGSAKISDDGIGTGANSFTVNTTGGMPAAANTVTDISGINVSWTGGTGRAVTIEGTANIKVNSITSTGPTPLPVSLFTTTTSHTSTTGTTPAGTITINGPVTDNGAFIGSGGNFSVAAGGSLTGTTVSVEAVTISTPDSKTLVPLSVVFSGPVVSHGNLTVQGTSVQVASTGAVTTTGGGFLLNSTGVVTIEGPVNTGGGAANVTSGATLTTDSNGTLTSVGGNISLEGATSVSVGAVVNTGGGNFAASGGTFTNSAAISDGGVNDSRVQGLSISTNVGNITVNGNISWAASLSPITFSVPTGSLVSLGGVTITSNSAEAINFSGLTLSLTSTQVQGILAGGNITLGPVVNGTSGSTPELEVASNGAVSLQTVGTSAAPFGVLLVTNNVNNNSTVLPVTTLHGNIFSNRGVDFAGTVNLPTNIQVAVTGQGQFAEFDGAIQGPGGLTVVLPSTNLNSSLQEIIFNSNIGDVTPVAFLNLFPGNASLIGIRSGIRTTPGPGNPQPATTIDIASGGSLQINNLTPTVRTGSGILATIDSYGPLNINIGSAASPNAANLYAVGQNEKLSINGSLNLQTNGGAITTGDISTIGNMTLGASRINFRLRGPTISASSNSPVALDSGMDLIAGGAMSLPGNATITEISGTPVAGAFGQPGFIAQSFPTSSNISLYASTLKTSFSIVGGIPAAALFESNNLLVDLTPNTLTVTIPSFVPPIPFVYEFSIAGAAPREQLVAGTVTTDFKVAYPPVVPGPIIQQDLKDTGIYSRDPSLDEILGTIGTLAIFDDMPDRPRPRASDYHVVTNRLDPNRVEAFVTDYNQVFGSDPAAKRTEISTSVQAAWDAYVSQSGDQPVNGAGFAHYCATTPSASAASANLRQLHDLRVQMGTLGLSYKEAQVAFQYNVLAGLSAVGMREGDLASAVASSGSGK